MPAPIPVIDISSFLERGHAATHVAHQVDRACRELGFLIIEGHGLDPAMINQCWTQAKTFFGGPGSVRMSASAPAGHPYGYHGFAAEALAASLGEETPPDLKETFNVGPLTPPSGLKTPAASFAHAANIWPQGQPGLRDAVENYYAELRRLSDQVMDLFAAALGLESGYFAPHFSQPMSALRVINYRALKADPEPGQLRAGAHTDYGTLTLLLQPENVRGLQVLSRDQWLDVPALPGTLVVNIGDLMAQWTNDRWVSTLHRVIVPEGEDRSRPRQSMVFFHTPNWDADICCLPTCLAKEEAPLYQPVQAGPHLAAKFRATVREGE